MFKALDFVIFLSMITLTGCFGNESTGEIRIGMIKYLNASEENMNALIKNLNKKTTKIVPITSPFTTIR